MPGEYTIEVDFRSDWATILRDELVALGYEIPVEEDPQAISHRYFNLQKRLIDPRPRTVLIAAEFSCPKEYEAGLEVIKEKIQKGEDLRPHLSTRITDLKYDDTLLNDWGIHHLHLGIQADAKGFVERTRLLLFARFDDEYAYFINVMPHGSWSRQAMVKTLHKNWPDSISRYRLQAVIGLDYNPTDEEIAALRKAGIVTLIEVEPGVVYAPIGGGYQTSGIGSDVVRISDHYFRRVADLEEHLRSGLKDFILAARERGFELGPKLKFRLIVDNKGTAFALEQHSRVAFQIGSL